MNYDLIDEKKIGNLDLMSDHFAGQRFVVSKNIASNKRKTLAGFSSSISSWLFSFSMSKTLGWGDDAKSIGGKAFKLKKHLQKRLTFIIYFTPMRGSSNLRYVRYEIMSWFTKSGILRLVDRDKWI